MTNKWLDQNSCTTAGTGHTTRDDLPRSCRHPPSEGVKKIFCEFVKDISNRRRGSKSILHEMEELRACRKQVMRFCVFFKPFYHRKRFYFHHPKACHAACLDSRLTAGMPKMCTIENLHAVNLTLFSVQSRTLQPCKVIVPPWFPACSLFLAVYVNDCKRTNSCSQSLTSSQ